RAPAPPAAGVHSSQKLGKLPRPPSSAGRFTFSSEKQAGAPAIASLPSAARQGQKRSSSPRSPHLTQRSGSRVAKAQAMYNGATGRLRMKRRHRMLSESILQALNKQITYEFSASHTYMAMSAYFESLNLPGFAHWFRVQSEGE